MGAVKIDDVLEFIAARLARRIISIGDEPIGKCHRIAFKIRLRTGERESGGLCENALGFFLKKELAKIWSEVVADVSGGK